LSLTFLAFFWICDIGFRRSIETTVNNASQTNLDTIRRLLEKTSDRGQDKIKEELEELSHLWANGALLEVADARGSWLFRSPEFALASPQLPDLRRPDTVFFTTNLNFQQFRIAMQRVKAGNETFEIRAAVPTEPFDQALDNFRLIEKECLPLLVLFASLLGYWLSGRSLAPVNRIIETAELVGV